jgi:hypothetical protein
MIDELNASKKSFIKETPQYRHEQFMSQQQKKFSNRKSDGRHPFSQQPSQTFYEDPLVVGSTHHRFGNFLEYNNRAISSETKHLHGGALMYKQPQGGELSSSDSDSDYSSSDEEGGELEGKSRDELVEMVQGAGIYNDYVKPAGRFLGNVGKEVFSEVIVPIGKELVKDAVMGAVVGAGKRGRPKGSKNKAKAPEPPVVEAIHLEHLVAPKVKKSKKVLANIENELKRVEKEKVFEEGMIKAEPKKRKPRSKKVLANIEDEAKRVESEKTFEEGKVKGEEGGKIKKKRVMSDKMKHRAEIVKKVMKEKGLKLGEASKYVKEHGMV